MTVSISKTNYRALMRLRTGIAILFLLTLSFALGIYATALNRLYYSTYVAFYDSVAYLDRLAYIIHVGRTSGIADAVKLASTACTVFLPFGIAAVLSPILPIERATAIWLQVPFVLFLLISVWQYFRLRFEAGPLLAAALATPVAAIAGFFWHNGGLSDFRMDLLLYLQTGSASVWLLIALHRQKPGDWVICGIFCTMACLSRATAVVYLVVMLAPLLGAHLLLRPERRWRITLGVLSIGLIWAVSALWFFILNYDYLYYYYFIWNEDANARLPLSEALIHFQFAFDSVGMPILIACLLTGVGNLLFISLIRRDWHWRYLGLTLEPFWLAVAPAGYLALRGAGLNPFVSMPSALGIVLLLLALPGTWKDLSQRRKVICAVVLFAGCLVSAQSGWQNHLSPPGYADFNAPYRKTVNAIRKSPSIRSETTVAVNMFGCGSATASSFRNYLIFSLGFSMDQDGNLIDPKTGQTLKIGTVGGAECATLVEWEKLPGESEEDRIQGLTNQLAESSDFLFVPTRETADYLEQNFSHNYINRYVPRLRDGLLKLGGWIVVREHLKFSDNDEYALLAKARNRHRNHVR